MALDTSVLKFQPPAGPSALEQAGQFANLQAIAGQKQLQQQQIQGGALDLQERQRQIDRSKALDQVYSSAYGPNGLDIDKFTQNASAAGLGSMIGPVQEHYTTYQKNLAETAKANAEAETAQANVAGRLAAHISDPAIDYDPHAFIAGAVQAVQSKAIPQATAAPILQQVQTALQQDPTGASAKAYLKQWASSTIQNSPEQVARVQKDREVAAAEKTADSRKETADREKQTADAAGIEKANQAALKVYALAPPEQKATALAALPPELQAKVKGLADDAVLQLGMTPAEIAADRRGKATAANTQAYQGNELAIQRARLKVEQVRADREAGLNTSTPFEDLPAALKPTALALSRGDIGFSALSRYPPKDRELITAGAFEKNPALSQALYDTKQNFKTKGDADKIGSITRVMGHMASYREKSEAEGISPGAMVGYPTEANTPTATAARAITDEFGYLVKHSALNEGEAKEYKAELNSGRPGVRKKAIDELETLMKSQFEATYQKYKTGSGGTVFPAHEFFDKGTMDLLRKQNALPEGYVEPGADHGIPDLGSTFNGGKVTKVTRIP